MNIVECPGCNAPIGEAINIEGMIFLRIGTLLIKDAQAMCMHCGRLFYWSVSNKLLSRIVQRALNKDSAVSVCPDLVVIP